MELLNEMQDRFFKDETVLAAALLGSVANGSQDQWSDLDFLLIVTKVATMQWPEMPLYGQEIHLQAEYTTVHCVYENMQIMDFVLIEKHALEANPSLLRLFQSKALKILFSKSHTIQNLLEVISPAPVFSAMTAAAFEEFQLRFWYQVRYTLQRILRNDFLIALHLSLELFQTVLVLRMILRDRESQSHYHPSSGTGNDYITQLAIKPDDYSKTGLLDFLAALISEFDELAQTWDSAYLPKKEPMLEFIKQVRQS